jgi:uncharacterized cupredoxin-like copper-binding protein
MSKLAKFFIICAAVCVLGIVMTFAGYAAGGVDDLQKVADKHEWLNVGPNSTETDLFTVGEFQSIEAEGSLDIAIVSPGQDLQGEEAPDFTEEIYAEGVAGTVAVRWGKGYEMPEVVNEEGVLKIKGSDESIDHVEVNLSGGDLSPDVIIFCADQKLDSIQIEDKYGDVSIDGVEAGTITAGTESGDIEVVGTTCDKLNAAANTGDLNAGHVTCSEMTMKTNTGDIDIQDAVGNVSAEVTTGDIEFETDLPKNQYEISVSTNTGTISIGEEEIESENSVSLPGGPNKLTLKTTTGDIDLDFMED